MAYLAANPLPADFAWFHRDGLPTDPTKGLRPVLPSYRIHAGYGKWLHDTPYFPGLFELIHDLLFHSGSTLPDTITLTGQLDAIKRERLGQQELF